MVSPNLSADRFNAEGQLAVRGEDSPAAWVFFYRANEGWMRHQDSTYISK